MTTKHLEKILANKTNKAAGTLMFLSDQETETDLIYYEAIAKTVVKLIRSIRGIAV